MKNYLSVIFIFTTYLLSSQAFAQTPEFAIAIHGGAGTIEKSKMTAEKTQTIRTKTYRSY